MYIKDLGSIEVSQCRRDGLLLLGVAVDRHGLPLLHILGEYKQILYRTTSPVLTLCLLLFNTFWGVCVCNNSGIKSIYIENKWFQELLKTTNSWKR